MKVLFIVGSVTVVFTLFVVLVWFYREMARLGRQSTLEPEIHHEASGTTPWEPAPFPESEPELVLDYQPCEPLSWWLNDEAVDRATGVK